MRPFPTFMLLYALAALGLVALVLVKLLQPLTVIP